MKELHNESLKHNTEILIIDDNKNICKTLKDILKVNYKVKYYLNSVNAIKWLEQNDYKVNLILLDLNMPKLDGINFLKSIKKNIKTIPIIIISSDNNIQNYVNTLNQGALTYIKKPFELDILTAQVSSILKFKSLLDDTINYSNFCEKVSYNLQNKITQLSKKQKNSIPNKNKNIESIIKLQMKITNKIEDKINFINQINKDAKLESNLESLKLEIDKFKEITNQYQLYQSLLN